MIPSVPSTEGLDLRRCMNQWAVVRRMFHTTNPRLVRSNSRDLGSGQGSTHWLAVLGMTKRILYILQQNMAGLVLCLSLLPCPPIKYLENSFDIT